MNERIKELADQAKEYSFNAIIKIADREKALDIYSESYDAKFAELIVKECCEVAHCNFHVDGLTLGNILREHFGVE